MISETALAIFLAYTPGLSVGLRMYGMRFEWWFTPIMFCVLIFLYDEIRKLIIRKRPGGKEVLNGCYLLVLLQAGWRRKHIINYFWVIRSVILI